MNVQSIILIDENLVPEDERADLALINAQLRVLAARRKDRLDLFDYPYRLSKIAWKVAELSNAMTYRFISLADGVALSWNNSNTLSAVLNARAIVETTAIYWEFGRQFSKLADALDFGAVDRLAMNYLFSTKDAKLLKERPELKARQVLSAIDLIDKSLIPHFRSHYDRLSELCHPNSMGHRSLFSKLDSKTGITEFGSGVLGDFFFPVKTALGTALIFDQSSVQIEKQTEAFAHAHHAARPSPLTE
jgi:hypothetical protein